MTWAEGFAGRPRAITRFSKDSPRAARKCPDVIASTFCKWPPKSWRKVFFSAERTIQIWDASQAVQVVHKLRILASRGCQLRVVGGTKMVARRPRRKRRLPRDDSGFPSLSSPPSRDTSQFSASAFGFKACIDSLIPLAERIQALAPVGEDLEKPNPEYPWLSGQHAICPADNDFREFAENEIVRFARFIETLLETGA